LYEESITLEFHGGDKQWVGNIGFNDNHVALLHTVLPEGYNYMQDEVPQPDNLFYNDLMSDCETGEGNDIWLTLVSRIVTDNGLDLVSECD
jgi:hypothetical protein